MRSRDSAAVVGVGAAACAVCCVGPILALVGAIGLGTILSVVAFGAVGLLVVLVAVPFLLRRRRRRCATWVGPVMVNAPEVRARG